MTSDFNDQIFEQNKDIFAALGFAISNFSGIEFGLLCLFDALSGLDQKKSASLFWSIGSTRNQIKAVDALAAETLENKHIHAEWRTLKKSIEKMVDERDRLAHGEVVPLQRTPQVKDVFFAPRFQKNIARSTGSGPLEWQPHERLDRDDLIELARQFWLVSRKIDALFVRIPKP